MAYLVQCPKGHVYTAPEGSGLEKAAQRYMKRNPEDEVAKIGSVYCKSCQREELEQNRREDAERKIDRLFGRK